MINGAELLQFEIAVMDLCEEMKVDNAHDLEELSYRLHQCIELAITDYINDDENLDIDDYEEQF